MSDSTAALLVVDAQRDVLAGCINSEQTIANIADLVHRARRCGTPVIWVRHNADHELVKGSPGWQIVPELVPAEGEPIVDKRYSDSFADTDLADRLAEVGADSVLLCGAQTDACIRNTFYGGIYRGYPTTLVGDAHTTEDMREWGSGYAPEDSIRVLNMHAGFTTLPNVSGAVTTTADAFGTPAFDTPPGDSSSTQ
jgi:nicotinamidase-related amidase